MNSGQLKYRHFHWVILGKNQNEEVAVAYRVTAENEQQAMELCCSILKRDGFRTVEVTECFTPHDSDELLAIQQKLVDKMPSKEDLEERE